MLHVACGSSTAYLPHSAAMLHSVLARNEPQNVHIHFLHGPTFPSDATELLERMVRKNGGRISFLSIPPDWVSGLPTWQYIESPGWYRIFLPELLPDVDRILYLDADTIVVDSLARLFAIDLSGHYVAAVTNVFQLNHLHRPAALGLDDPRSYFNSGVLVMNLELMRRDGMTSLLREYGRRHAAKLEWLDQDALNVVLGERRRPLHPRWNCMNSVLRFPWSPYVFGAKAVEEARRAPAILHFEGPSINKPWHYLCDSEMREAYLDHRPQTPWPDVRLEGFTPGNVIRRRWREGRRLAGRGRRRLSAALKP
jgi:lipopolysaccharide biosynthesis glycosyltransferase